MVIEGDIATSDRYPELEAGVRESANRFCELPHNLWIFRRSEVQTVGHREGYGARGTDVSVGLGKRKLGTGVRIEFGETTIAVGGNGDTTAGFLVNSNHPGVLGLGEDRVAQDVAVVLIGYPGLAREVR